MDGPSGVRLGIPDAHAMHPERLYHQPNSSVSAVCGLRLRALPQRPIDQVHRAPRFERPARVAISREILVRPDVVVDEDPPWVQTGSFGYSYWWANGRLETDGSGHYAAPNIPAARITLWAAKTGYVQPCAVEADVDRDLHLNIEVMSEASLDVSAQAPRTATGSLLSGAAFETTDEGRQPIRAALVWAEFGGGITAATTKTDAKGRFIMCNLPRDTWLTIQKGGYVDAELRVPDQPATPLDVELKRR